MAWSVGLAVDLASGVLLAALGAWVLTLRPRRSANVALAAFLALFGAAWITHNLTEIVELQPAGTWVTAALFAATLPSVGAMALLVPRAPPRSERAGALAAFVLFAAGVAVFAFVELRIGRRLQPSAADAMWGRMLALLILALACASLAWALRYRAATAPADRRRFAFVSVATGAYPVLWLTVSLLGLPDSGFPQVGPLEYGLVSSQIAIVLLAPVVAWVWNAASRPEPHLARNACLTLVAAGIAGVFTHALEIPDGPFGLARTFGVLLLTVAILRGQFLDVDMRVQWTIRRGTLAGAFVAAFFVASEAAQVFFGDASGSQYVGVAAAGALVFAIAPLSRIADRIAERAVPLAIRDAPASSAESAYRAAVRIALRDGVLTQEEERALLRLAEHAGIPATRALAIHEEMEQEVASR